MDPLLYWIGFGLLVCGILVGYPLGAYMEQRDRRRREDPLNAQFIFEKEDLRHAD